MTAAARPAVTPFDHGQPIARIDTLPIAIFLLCLLAMFLVGFERPVHALTVDLPAPYSDGIEDMRLGLPIDKIVVTDEGSVLWNGEAVTPAALAANLERAARVPERATLRFEPAPAAGYGEVLEVLGAIWRAGMTEDGFCFDRIDRYRSFGKRRGDIVADHRDEPGESCRSNALPPDRMPMPMPMIVEPTPKPPVDYYIW